MKIVPSLLNTYYLLHNTHMSVLVSGSTAYDVLLGYDGSFADAIDPASIENLSVSFFSPHFKKHHGGTGANIAWGLKLLGQDPILVSSVGSDGGEYLALFEDRGMRTEFVEKIDSHVTATAIIGTDSGERQIAFFHPGADGFGTLPDLSPVRDDCSWAIISPRNAKLMSECAQWCKEFGVPYIFDPGQQIPALGDDVLRRMLEESAGLIVNKYEWQLVSERLSLSLEEALEITEFVIVTKGSDGLDLNTRESSLPLVACRAEQVVNPTGAGDATRSGLLTGLSLGWSLEDAGKLGSAMGSFAVEIEGTLLDYLDMDILRSRAKATYGNDLPQID